ncbi:hypothetical protein HED50_12725 [Ochrobactrum oryzae]|nr:hypothetical protein [Brucella oryzae]
MRLAVKAGDAAQQATVGCVQQQAVETGLHKRGVHALAHAGCRAGRFQPVVRPFDAPPYAVLVYGRASFACRHEWRADCIRSCSMTGLAAPPQERLPTRCCRVGKVLSACMLAA